MQTTDAISAKTTKEILISAPLPLKTESYSPVPHIEVINTTLEALEKSGLKLKSERYLSTREGRQAMGFYDLEGGDETMGMKIQWHNSYDKSMPLRAAAGANVFICTNGMVRGDAGAFKRKHTGTVLEEFKESIKLYIGNMEGTFKRLVTDRERMKNVEITKRATAELLGRLFIEDALINATQLGIIKKELEAPTHDYNAKGTIWELYNYATFAMKEAHPMHNLSQHIELHEFFVEEFELA